MMRDSRIWLSCLLGLCAGSALAANPLRVEGRHFADSSGRVIVLRGVNLAGDSKVPPFVPVDHPAVLDPLPALGFNAVRLVLSWEAFEPRPGSYDLAYIRRMKALAAECGARGLYVIVDIHQDGFSRYLSKGSGDGFPVWASSPRARLHEPDNSPKCADWPIRMAFDPGMHRSFRDFYSDRHGVRTKYLQMMVLVAGEFSTVPMVIGYDLMNEPWGYERSELAPLYEDAAKAVRSQQPGAILFIEGHVVTNAGLQTKLPRPTYANFAYSPHYYKPTTVLFASWSGGVAPINRAFSHMAAKADEWNAPLFVSEFGVSAVTRRGGDYIAYLYDRLDDTFASGTQWNYTPHWTPARKDGWNGEDFNIVSPGSATIRPNFRPRPFPRAIAGRPCAFRYQEAAQAHPAMISMTFDADPGRGMTELFVPLSVFPIGSQFACESGDATCGYDPATQVATIRVARPGRVTLRILAPR